MTICSLSVWNDLQTIKQNRPLVHNITNYVVMEQTANSLLAIGASPIMAHATEEVEDIVKISNSLILNIGTLSPPWITGMKLSLIAAHAKRIPIILDPVGSGATLLRTSTAQELLKESTINAIRGNTSEINSLLINQSHAKGVDSLLDASKYVKQAKALALKYQCSVWMSGKTDIVTDGKTTYLIHNGHSLMTQVTGMGCTASAISGAFLAVNKDTLIGLTHAALLMGIVGEIASQNCSGPGSFKLAFIDTLYNISLENLTTHIHLETIC